MTTLEQIKELSNKRQEIWNQYQNSWNEDQNYNEPEPKEIDELGNEILTLLRQNHNDLPVDFVIEELTKLGHAPNLVYDDNGNFALVSDGFQTISVELDSMELYVYVPKEAWKPTIREALDYYLNEPLSEDTTPSTEEELFMKIKEDERNKLDNNIV